MKVIHPSPGHRLGALQLKVVQILWERGEATVAMLHQLLGRRGQLAYVTIATVLRRLEARGLVAHRTEGRTFVYRAVVGKDTVARTMARELVDRLFGGSVAALFSNLLSQREIDPAELAELERLIRERKQAV